MGDIEERASRAASARWAKPGARERHGEAMRRYWAHQPHRARVAEKLRIHKAKPDPLPRWRGAKYGLGPGEFDLMVLAQNGCCALCLKPTPDLVIDHDHETGAVRGLLCNACNLALGGYEMLRGNPRVDGYLIGEAA